MPTYSSSQFFQDWRYATGKDFVTSDGKPFPRTDSSKQEWGDEIKKVTFEKEAHDACASSDGTRLAVAVEDDIHIVDTETWETATVLKGHVSRVSALAFRPRDANTLVSSEQHDYGRSDPSAEPVIIVWKIDHSMPPSALEGESLKEVGAAAASSATTHLADKGVALSRGETQELESAFIPAVARIVTRHSAAQNTRLVGRLQTHFQSEIFSPSGRWMAYLPGRRPRSNSNVPWAIRICSTDDFKDAVTLDGHTDAIMWTGWNPDESLIASVSWDKTVRIWDASTGKQRFSFLTDGQNWTGAFSSDSKYFVATCGQGSVQVYSLADGSTRWIYRPDRKGHWMRALSWHPNGKWLAVGGRKLGWLAILDIDKKEVLQERTLSLEAADPDDEAVRPMMGGILEVSTLQFANQGQKLVIWTSGDCSIEAYDLFRETKWRFARGGTEESPKSRQWRDEKGKVTSNGGHGMVIWETRSNGKLLLASIDFDAIRIWCTQLEE